MAVVGVGVVAGVEVVAGVDLVVVVGVVGCVNTRLIVGIDPGVTTGVCLVANGPEDLKILRKDQIVSIPCLMQALQGMDWPRLVVMEDYLGAGHRHKAAVHTIQVIGAVKGWAAIHDVPVEMQPPQWRKPFVTEARILLKSKHSGRHAADALAHILGYIYREKRDL